MGPAETDHAPRRRQRVNPRPIRSVIKEAGTFDFSTQAQYPSTHAGIHLIRGRT
jgi:hypothetical protein